MRTIKIKGHKLEAADVTHVSLVDHGANRIPFRVLKSESDTESSMSLKIALTNIFAGKKKDEAPAPTISAFVLQKGEHFEAAKTALASIGANVEDTEEQDDYVVFKQDGEVDYDKDIGIQGKAVAVLLKAFNPYDMRAASYTDILKTQGFLPSLQTANEALFQSVINTISKGDITPDALVSEVESSLGEFSNYIVGLCKSIPATAFKADAAVTEAIAAEVKKAAAKPAPKAKAKDDKKKEDADDKGKKKDDAPAFDAKALKEMVTAAMTDAVASITKTVKGVSDAVTALKSQVKDVSEAVDGIKETADEALDTAKKAETRVKGKAVTDANDDGAPDGRRKNEDDDHNGEMGPIDTAFMPHLRTKRGYEDRKRAAETPR